MYLLIESEFSRRLESWSWYGSFAGASRASGAEAFMSWGRQPSKAPWYEHRRNGAEHEWWFGRLHVQWTPQGWAKHRVPAEAA